MRKVLIAGALVLASAAVALAGGIPRGNNQDQNGPCGYPSLKKLVSALTLTHDQEQTILRIYNDYKHKEREEAQAAKKDGGNGKPSGDLKGAMTNEVKVCLTDDQKKKLDDLLSQKKKK